MWCGVEQATGVGWQLWGELINISQTLPWELLFLYLMQRHWHIKMWQLCNSCIFKKHWIIYTWVKICVLNLRLTWNQTINQSASKLLIRFYTYIQYLHEVNRICASFSDYLSFWISLFTAHAEIICLRVTLCFKTCLCRQDTFMYYNDKKVIVH